MFKGIKILWYKFRIKWLEVGIDEAEADIRVMKTMKARLTRQWMRLQKKIIDDNFKEGSHEKAANKGI